MKEIWSEPPLSHGLVSTNNDEWVSEGMDEPQILHINSTYSIILCKFFLSSGDLGCNNNKKLFIRRKIFTFSYRYRYNIIIFIWIRVLHIIPDMCRIIWRMGIFHSLIHWWLFIACYSRHILKQWFMNDNFINNCNIYFRPKNSLAKSDLKFSGSDSNIFTNIYK